MANNETIKWKKLDAGEYESEDERFYILKTYDNLYGNHWKLWDRTKTNNSSFTYCEQTLTECKEQAEWLAKHKK